MHIRKYNTYTLILSDNLEKFLKFQKENPSDEKLIFINLSKCVDDIHTASLVMAELLRHSAWLHDYDSSKEEKIISWAENETLIIVRYINFIKENINKPNVRLSGKPY